MTLLGKSLALATLALSLLFFGFALGIYANRIDWPGGGKTPTGEKSVGEIERLQADVGRWTRDAGLARTRYLANSDALTKLEKKRPDDQKWYAEQIALLKEGPVDEPVKVIVMKTGKKGQLELDAAGHPLMQPPVGDRPLHSRRAYEQELRRVYDEFDATSRNIARLESEQKELTLRINGEPGRRRGLRTLLAEEELAAQNCRAELDYLRPIRINLQVQGELLQKRQRGLAARLDELKRSGIAALAPVTSLDSPIVPRHTPRP